MIHSEMIGRADRRTWAVLYSPRFWRLALLPAVLALAGCATPGGPSAESGSGNVKVRGVYTTTEMAGENLEMPGSGYLSQTSFASNQIPAAVVVGYGGYSGNTSVGQDFELRLIETSSGATIQTSPGTVFDGKAYILSLPIRKSGKYQVRLVMGDAVADTWDFTVERGLAPDTVPIGGEAPPPYAKGVDSVSLEGIPDNEAVSQYDNALLYSLNVAVGKEFTPVNREEFAQIPPGEVTIQFDLNDAGQVSNAKIIDNTLSAAIGQFYLRALAHGAPYKTWPPEVRAALGTSSRPMKAVFRLD